MGHLNHLKQEYRDLVSRLDAGQTGLPEPERPEARAGLQEILEILFTPEEAALAARLPVAPVGLEELARQLGESPEALKPRLDAMADKGVVFDLRKPSNGKVSYVLAPPVVGFFEFSLMRAHDSIPKKRMAEALEAYCSGDPAFAHEAMGGDTVVGRALTHEGTLNGDVLPEVLDWEKATAVIESARQVSVSLCYCRHKASHLGRACDVPQEICLTFNTAAEFVIRRKFGRPVERSEALDMLAQSRERGLVQIADNVQNRPAYLCNCCSCCCEQLRTIHDYGLRGVNPSGFVPRSDAERCAGCGRCARACPVTAITMAAQRVTASTKNQMEPHIDDDRCIGCGVCATVCRKHAMDMQRRAERPYVPASAVERAVRMALERNKLPDLIAVQSATVGAGAVGRVLAALCRLKPAEKLLANEQMRSRFVQFILRRAEDPTV